MLASAMDHLALPEQAIDAFEALTGLRVCVHDLRGRFGGALAPERAWHGGPLCAPIKQGPFAHRCEAFEIHELRPQLPHLAVAGGRVHRCHAGLVEWVVPIRQEDEVVAVVFAGQRRAADWQPQHLQRASGARVSGVPPVDAATASHLLEGLRQLAGRLGDWLARQAGGRPAAGNRAARIRHYIDQQHTGPANLAGLAGSLELSMSRTAHVVQEETGRSFSQLLSEARLRTACRLLRHSDMAVAAVALSSGFGDQSHFQKVFRRHFGLTPGRYRRDPEIASLME